MPDPTVSAAPSCADGRDRFRGAVATLPAGPLRDVLVAVAYTRDAAARTGSAGAPDDRWLALVAVAERAVRDAAALATLAATVPAPPPAAPPADTVPAVVAEARSRVRAHRRATGPTSGPTAGAAPSRAGHRPAGVRAPVPCAPGSPTAVLDTAPAPVRSRRP